MKIKTKLTACSLLMALVPVMALSVTLGWMAIKSSNETIESLAMEHLVSVRENNKARIERYFAQINNQLLTFANDKMIIDAMSSFKYAVNELELQKDTFNVPAIKKQLDKYYSGQFAPEYDKRNNRSSIATSNLLDQLDETGAYLQYLYIQKNTNPLGSKNNLDAAKDGSQYSEQHGIYHPHINDYLKKFSYYDIFLVDPDSGRIVYSVFKKLDYATSLINGAYADSGLGIAFQRANSSNKTETFLEGFKPYTPSYEDPASFIATPIFDQGNKIGVLVFQMPIDEINKIMTNNQQWKTVGMGNTGESYIVGSDYKTLSLRRLLIEDKSNYLAALTSSGVSSNVINDIKIKNSNIGLQAVNTSGAKAAISGQTDEQIFSDYRNVSVLSAFSPLKIKGVKWAILAEIDEAEAFLPAEELQSKIITTSLIGIVLVAVVSVFIGLLFANYTALPMIKIVDAMKSISKGGGDLTQRLDESKNDEIADIAHYFNSFVVSIQHIVQEIAEYSKQLASAAEQVSATAVQTNINVNDQQLQIEQVATAMNEMAATVLDVAKNASQAAVEAQKGDVETKAGGKVIEDTINAINQLNSNITNAAETVSTLEEDGQSIGTVLDVIRGIAEQTNLLALNAAIEAARAGEQGRGFAVVADEVRTLASRTQDSTEEIQSMIEKLQQGTKKSAGAMANSVKLAEDAVNQAHGGTNALHNITHAITTIDDMTAQIASASEEQSAVAEEINRNIISISDSSRNTVASSDESSHAGEEITKLATILSAIVNQFKY